MRVLTFFPSSDTNVRAVRPLSVCMATEILVLAGFDTKEKPRQFGNNTAVKHDTCQW